MKKIRKGFTLVEVICVLTIIAIIAAIAVPNISGYIEKSKINNCRSIMTDFVNDLEYKIVSKRYYDISELNDELVEYVKNSSAVEPEIKYTETDNSRTTSVEAKICPNDGTYKLSWTISPNIDSESNVTDIYTANVKVSDCVCKCVTGENSVVHTGHDFTAALVASEYIDSGKTPEQKYEEIINGIIDDVGGSTGGTGNLSGIVNEVEGKNPGYEIAGLTTTLDKKVEWISVYYHDTFSAEESKYKFLTKSGGKSGELIIKDLTEAEFNDKLNWPPAEGTSGSFVFKEGWNKDVVYYVANLDVIDPTTNKSIGWIQRDGNWYVQKSNDVKGIDLTVDKNDENSTLSGHPLISDDGCKLKDNDAAKGNKLLKIQATSNPDWSNLKKSLQIVAEYENGNKITFDHISATDLTKDDYSIKNGFIIVSSESDVSSKKWAGIYENSTSADSEKTTLQSLLDNEDELIGKFLSGENSELIIAYQEYHKTYDAKTKDYSSVPITCFGKLVRDENSTPGKIYIKNEDNDVIFTIGEVQTIESNYEIIYNQSPESNNKFRVEDLSIKKTVTHIVKDENDNTIYTFEDDVEIKHVGENDDNSTLRFYISNYNGYSKDKENECVANLNNGYGTTWIFLGDVSLEYDKWSSICQIDTCNSDGYSWNYEKGQNDNEFDVNKINVSISYKLSLSNTSYTVSIEGSNKIVHELSHRTESNSNDDPNGFFYISESNSNEDTYKSIEETGLINKINSCAAKAYIKIYKSGDRQYGNNHTPIGFVNTYLNSVKADYTNDGSAFSFDKLTASAGYIIEFKDYDGADPHEQINHFISLNHDDNSDNRYNRYYMSLYNCNDDWSERNDVKNNEQSAITEILKKTECTAYVVFCDKRTRCDDIYINVTSSINPPDVVYIPDSEGSTDARMIAYIGTNQNVTVPASHTGYWSLSEPASGVEFIKKEVNMQSVGTQTYYFINDGKTYTISQIGTVPVNPPNIDDSYKIKFPSGYTLQTLKISDKVKTIGEAAFMDSGITSLTFADNSSLNVIGSCAFKKCEQLENLDLPDSVTEIGKEAFANLESVKTIKLGNSVTSIGISAFANCKANETTEFIIPNTVTSIGENAFNCIEMQNAKMIIKGVSDSSDYSIGGNIFNGANFMSLEIGENVKIVGANAFSSTTFNNNSSSLTLGDSVKEIQNAAFKGCGFTEKLNLNKVEKIGDEAFMNCSHFKYGLTIPETVESIGREAFDSFASAYNNNDGNIGQLVINGGSYKYTNEENVTKYGLGGLIFTNAIFNGVTIGGNVTKIDKDAFKNSPYKSLTPYNDIKGSLTICESVTEIGENAFKDCARIEELKLSNNLKSISNGAFYGCSGLSGNLVISGSVESVGAEAFKNCTGFNGTLTLGNGLKTIGAEAFAYCKNFQGGLTIPVSVKNGIGNLAFREFAGDTSSPGILELKSGSYNDGKSIGAFIFTGAKFTGMTIGGNVETIDADAFHHGGQLTSDNSVTADYSKIIGSVILQDKVTTVEKNAFYGCKGLNGTISMPEVTSIGAQAFENCENLKGNLALVKVSEIGSDAFKGCKSLDGNLTMSAVTKIGSKAFYDCVKLHGGVMIPNTVSEIGHDAFRNFASKAENTGTLTILGGSSSDGTKLSGQIFLGAKFNGLYIGGKVTEIEEYAFYDSKYSNSDFESAYTAYLSTIPHDNVTPENYYSSFSGNITIGSSVKKIGKYAFSGYSSAGKLEFEEPAAGSQDKGINEIYEGAFAYCKKLQGGLYIPPTVVKIESYAFDSFASDSASIGPLHIFGCSGKENSSNEFGYIDKNIFNNSKFNDILISGKVAVIKAEAFKGCTGLTGTLTISGNVEEIQKNAFDTCENLTGLSLENGHIKKIYEGAFARCKRVEGGLYIPPTVNYMERCAFKQFAELTPDDKIGELRVYGSSDSEGNLGDPALDDDGAPLFPSSKFKNVIIGKNVKHINHDQFNNSLYYDFSTLTGDESVTVNGEKSSNPYGEQDNSFNFSGITGNLTIEEGVQTIGHHSFSATRFDSVNIPKSVNNIGIMAFRYSGTGNGSLTILGSSESDGTLGGKNSYIFLGAKYKDVTIGGSATKIGEDFMHNLDKYKDSQGEMIRAKENVTFIYYNGENKVTETKELSHNIKYSDITGNLTILDEVISIGQSAFESCNFDGRLLLGVNADSVKLDTIDKYAFKSCNKFTGDLIIPPSMKKMELDSFYCFAADSSKPGELILWAGSSDNGETIGQEVFVGSKFHNVKINGKVNKIAENAFININDDKSRLYDKVTGTLSLAPGVKEIGANAFQNCVFDGALLISDQSDIADVNKKPVSALPKVSIGANAFSGCTKFYTNNPNTNSFEIPETVTSIGNKAFESFASDNAPGGGPSLIIHGGSDGTTLKKDIFQYSRFNNVTIGGNVKTIDAEAFKSDYKVYDGLTGNLTIETKTVETIKSGAFKNAAGFNGKLELGSVKTIEDNAFYNCVNFSGGLNIPYGMNGIGTDAFYRFARETKDPGLFDLWSGTRVENNLQYLSGQPFRGAQFKDMKIHGSVNVIDNNAFNSYNINDGDDFRNFTGSLIFTSETEIGSWAFCCDTGFDGELLFETDSDGKGVSKIGEGAFSGCTNFYKTIAADSRELVIPETVNKIGKEAFSSFSNSLWNPPPKLVVLGGSNGDAFGSGDTTHQGADGKYYFDTIDIFPYAHFKDITFGGKVTTIAENAFNNTNGKYDGIQGSLTLKDNAKYIWARAFYNCSGLETFNLPSDTVIWSDAFTGTKYNPQ